MNAITSHERNFLQLLLRSTDLGGGWRKVSRMVWPLVTGFGRAELIEAEAFSDGSGRVRLTERGLVVVDYL